MCVVTIFSVILAALSILVTALMVWQIWNVIQVEKRIKKAVTETKSELNKSIELTRNDSIGAALSQLGMSQYYVDDHSGALRSLFNSIKLLNDGNKNTDINKECRCYAIKALADIAKLNMTVSIDEDTRTQWIACAKLTNNEEILRFALSVTTTSTTIQ